MSLRILTMDDLSDEDLHIINSLANTSPASPHGARTADMMVPEKDEEEDEEEGYGDGYAGLLDAGMYAMNTGDISALGPAMAGLNMQDGQSLFDVARENWQGNKDTWQGHKDAMAGIFSGKINKDYLPNPATMPNGNPPIPIPPGFEGTPVPIPPAEPFTHPWEDGFGNSFEDASMNGPMPPQHAMPEGAPMGPGGGMGGPMPPQHAMPEGAPMGLGGGGGFMSGLRGLFGG